MKKFFKIQSACLILFIVLGTCVFLGHHDASNHSSHHQHAYHTTEEDAQNDSCEKECCCQKVASIPSDAHIINQTNQITYWSMYRVAKRETTQKIAGYAMARDGPLFTEAFAYAREIVMRT